MIPNERGPVAKELLTSFKSGLPTFIGLCIVVFIVKFFLSLSFFTVTNNDVLNFLFALVMVPAIVCLLGVINRHTSFVSWFRRVFGKRSTLLRSLSSFFSRRDKEDSIAGDEVLFYEEETVRWRGFIRQEKIKTKQGRVWVVVHFSSPPFAGTGGWQKEYELDDRRLKFTGRPFSDHALYLAGIGVELEEEDEDEIDRITLEKKRQLKKAHVHNPSRE